MKLNHFKVSNEFCVVTFHSGMSVGLEDPGGRALVVVPGVVAEQHVAAVLQQLHQRRAVVLAPLEATVRSRCARICVEQRVISLSPSVAMGNNFFSIIFSYEMELTMP